MSRLSRPVYAQTNLQLFAQLMRAQVPEPELALLRRAYVLAVELFTGLVRPNGKPFLAHAVGTASVLAELGADAETVAAGMLHAAYALGDFGDGRRGRTPSKQRRLCDLVGEGVERRITRYNRLRWSGARIREIQKEPDALDALDREVVLMRLANELEDHLDLGACFVAEPPGRDRLEAARDLAEALGHPRLAEDLRACLAAEEAVRIPPWLRGVHARTFLVAPRSHRVRPLVRLARLLGARARHRVRR